jgi:hypothetical protein
VLKTKFHKYFKTKTRIFPAYIDYVRVPTGDDASSNFVGEMGTVAGWGFTVDGIKYKLDSNFIITFHQKLGSNKMTDVLRYSFNEMADPNVCVSNYGAEWMNTNKLCVGTTGGRGPCYVS